MLARFSYFKKTQTDRPSSKSFLVAEVPLYERGTCRTPAAQHIPDASPSVPQVSIFYNFIQNHPHHYIKYSGSVVQGYLADK